MSSIIKSTYKLLFITKITEDFNDNDKKDEMIIVLVHFSCSGKVVHGHGICLLQGS